MHVLNNRSFVWVILGLIVILASVLRLYQLGKVPVSLYWDETADAYNAYSIDKTLRDEHSHFMPMLFESFGDYKMPAMIYMMAGSIAVFGLNEFAVRLPMATLGILMVLATYFLVKELLSLESFGRIFPEKNRQSVIELISLLSAFLLAISPWHLQFSRTGYEASGAVAFIVFGMIFFLRSFKHPRLLILSAVLLGISFYFYRSVFIFLPLFLLVLFFIFRKELHSKIPLKIFILALVIGAIIVLPITYKVFTPPGSVRGNQVNIFSNSSQQVALNQMWAIQSGNGYLGNIFYNKRFVYLKEFLDNYFVNLSPQFLFLNGDPNPRQSTRNMGVMYIWEIIFVLLGGYALLIYFGRKTKITMFSWLLLGPVPAAIAIDNPHALRALNMLPIPQIIVAIGIVYGFYLCRRWIKPLYIVVVAGLIVFFLFSYLFNYYTTSTFLTASDWGDGYKQMNQYVLAHQSQYGVVLISGHYWEPYVYTLLYSQYDPATYQKSGNQYHFGKYIFGGTSWETHGPPELGDTNLYTLTGGKKALVVLAPNEYDKQKDHIRVITQIKDITNTTVFYIGQLLPQTSS